MLLVKDSFRTLASEYSLEIEYRRSREFAGCGRSDAIIRIRAVVEDA